MNNDDDESLPCRREFLQNAGCFGMTLALLGLGAAAEALPVAPITGTGDKDQRTYPLPAMDSVNIDRSAGLILARYMGKVFVFALACPHENYAVKWVAKDHRFQCTKHDSQYDPVGVHTSGRATRNMDRYVIKRDGNNVVVDLHHWIQSDKDPKGWDAAAIAV